MYIHYKNASQNADHNYPTNTHSHNLAIMAFVSPLWSHWANLSAAAERSLVTAVAPHQLRPRSPAWWRSDHNHEGCSPQRRRGWDCRGASLPKGMKKQCQLYITYHHYNPNISSALLELLHTVLLLVAHATLEPFSAATRLPWDSWLTT